MRPSHLLAPAFALVSLLVAGCQSLTDSVCTLEARAAIGVLVRDSVSGTAPDTAGAVVLVVDGVYRDTAEFPQYSTQAGTLYYLARERAGRYTVRVEQPGYQPWERTGVRVTRDECHVRTVELIALLQSAT